MFKFFCRRKACRDTLAHKIARLQGELVAITYLLDYYRAKRFDPHTVPECWKHAANVQMIHDLMLEYTELTKHLQKLQNKDTQAYKGELDAQSKAS